MYRKNIRPARLIALTLTLAVAGCSSLDLGPEPSNDVGPRSQGAELMTDPGLGAVTSAVSGATPAGIRDVTGTGGAVIPETMPSATEPTTTQPSASTNPAGHAGLGTGETVGSTALAPGAFEPENELTLQDAIFGGLQNNTGLVIQRLNVPIARTKEVGALGPFDPTISGQVAEDHNANKGGVTGPTSHEDTVNGNVTLGQNLPTGTSITATYATNNGFF